VDVKASRENMDRMLAASGGKRDVPVIVAGDEVTIGYGGT